MEYDVVVIGAGIVGSYTAYQLVKSGVQRVLLLEQFHALHTRGSSHGGSRLLRRARTFGTIREGAKMVAYSMDMYAGLQRQCGVELCHSSDMLYIGHQTDPELKLVCSNIQRNSKIPDPTLSAQQVNQRYSSWLSLPSHFSAVLEPDIMIIRLTNVLTQLQELFMRGGGVLTDQTSVNEIVPGKVITLKTSNGDYCCHKLVVTAGAWTSSLLNNLHLPVNVVRAEVFYWKVDNPKYFKPDVLPCVSFERGTEHYYAFPALEYPDMIKMYKRTYRDIDVDDRDKDGAGPSSQEHVVKFISKYLKGVSTTPAIFEPCVYSMTPDRLPIVDHVPEHPNIMFAAGMSGNGVMVSPALGLVLSEMVLNKPLSFDLSAFRLARFQTDSKL